MWELLRIVARSVVSALGQRRDLALENLALRHQLSVLKRQAKKFQLEDRDRLFWIGIKRFWAGWSGALHLVQPAPWWGGTALDSATTGAARAPPGGRPKIDPEIRKLIRDMWNANPTDGQAPHPV